MDSIIIASMLYFLLYLNDEMLRSSVSVVGRSVLSLVDVVVKMQLLLLFDSVPSLLFIYNHSEGNCNLHFYYLRIVQMKLFYFCNGTMTL